MIKSLLCASVNHTYLTNCGIQRAMWLGRRKKSHLLGGGGVWMRHGTEARPQRLGTASSLEMEQGLSKTDERRQGAEKEQENNDTGGKARERQENYEEAAGGGGLRDKELPQHSNWQRSRRTG